MGQLLNFWAKHKASIVLVLIACISLPNSFTIYPGVQLDSSWERAINMAIHNKLVFGREFVFTYGPLGFLETRNGAFISKIIFLLFDFFLVYGFYRIFKTIKKTDKSTIVFLILCMMALRFDEMNYPSTKLFIVYLFLLIKIYNDDLKDRTDLVYCGITAVILLFIKINYGFVALFLLSALVIISLFRDRVAASIVLASFFVSYFLLTWTFNFDLVNYLRYGAQLISGYNDAMFLPIENKRYIFLLFAISDLLLLFIIVLRSFAGNWKNGKLPGYFLKYALFALFAFLCFKNGFVRSHFLSFFTVFPLFIFLVCHELDAGDTGIYKKETLAILLVTFLVFGVYYKADIIIWAKSKQAPSRTFVKACLPVFYFTDILNTEPDPSKNERIYLPTSIIDEVKNNSIDIIPKDISIAQLNDLNYKPRPVPQSYAVISKDLDSLNAAFLSSFSRPDYLIVSLGSIDNRYAFWDEALTKCAVYLNYHYERSFDLCDKDTTNKESNYGQDASKAAEGELLLLRSNDKSTQKKPVFEKLGEFDMGVGETKQLDIPDTIPVFMEVSIHYSLAAQIIKTFFQPPLLNIRFGFEDGSTVVYRCVHPLMASPLLINRSVRDNSGLVHFFKGELQKNKKISSICFPKKWGWDKGIKITLYKMLNY